MEFQIDMGAPHLDAYCSRSSLQFDAGDVTQVHCSAQECGYENGAPRHLGCHGQFFHVLRCSFVVFMGSTGWFVLVDMISGAISVFSVCFILMRRFTEPNVHVPVPIASEEGTKVLQFVPQERISQRTVWSGRQVLLSCVSWFDVYGDVHFLLVTCTCTVVTIHRILYHPTKAASTWSELRSRSSMYPFHISG